MARIVFDALSHQAIRALGTEHLHYEDYAAPQSGRWRGTRLAGAEAALRAAGHEAVFARPERRALAGAAALIVASRSEAVPFEGDETDAVRAFVAAGGGLWLMANHRRFVPPQQAMARALGLPMAFNHLSIVDWPEVAMVDGHPIAEGCEGLAVRNTTSLVLAAGAKPVAFLRADPRHVFAATARVDAGRVLATGDSGFIASLDDAGEAMLDLASNARFFRTPSSGCSAERGEYRIGEAQARRDFADVSFTDPHASIAIDALGQGGANVGRRRSARLAPS